MSESRAIPAAHQTGLSDAVALLDSTGQQPWTVMISTPSQVWFAQRHDHTWDGPPASLLDHATTGTPPPGFPDGAWAEEAFSLRAFDGHTEVRWIKGYPPVGVPAAPDTPPTAPQSSQWTPWRRYLIGQGTGRTEGNWSLMASSRIGSYPVPARIQAGQRAVFRVTEVTGQDDRHGTVTVIDEVILAIEPDHADDPTATREAS